MPSPNAPESSAARSEGADGDDGGIEDREVHGRAKGTSVTQTIDCLNPQLVKPISKRACWRHRIAAIGSNLRRTQSHAARADDPYRGPN